MIDTPRMTSEQTRHLTEAGELWKAYGPLLRQKRQLVGGLQWKTVAGNEYLYRYQPDPITKQKRSTSVGRRGPETEALYQEFTAQRDKLTGALAALEPRLDTQRRVAKALRLNRLSVDTANVIATLWEDNLHEHMMALGDTAVGAYEVLFGRLLPMGDDDGVVAFMIPDDEDFVESLLASLRRLDRTYELIGNAVTGENGPRVWIYGRDEIGFAAAQHLEHEDAEVFEELLDQPASPTVATSKSGALVPVTAIHPVAFAVWEQLSSQDSERSGVIATLALSEDLVGAGPQEILATAAPKVPIATTV